MRYKSCHFQQNVNNLTNEVAKFCMFLSSADTSSSFPTGEASGLGVIEYDCLKETLGKKSRRVNREVYRKRTFP